MWKPHQKILWGNFFMASWVKSPKFRNFTGFSRVKFLVSVTYEKQNNFFYNSSKFWAKFHEEHFKIKTEPLFIFCACSKVSFWSLVRLYAPIVTYLAFQNDFLVPQARDTLWPWIFPKDVFLTKELDWWCHFQLCRHQQKLVSHLWITH